YGLTQLDTSMGFQNHRHNISCLYRMFLVFWGYKYLNHHLVLFPQSQQSSLLVIWTFLEMLHLTVIHYCYLTIPMTEIKVVVMIYKNTILLHKPFLSI